MKISRRKFVAATAAMGALSVTHRTAVADPLGLPLGLQLFSVRKQMADDLDGTFAAVAAAGFTEVEAATLPKKSAAEIRSALNKAGLRCVSAHHPFGDLAARFDEIVAYDKQLGVKFLICASPGYRDPAQNAAPWNKRPPVTLDDWRYNAEQFNAMGEKTAAKGVRFGYHNHVGEFAMTDGKVPYMELLALTDPKKVTFELDCGWAIVGGMKPVEIMEQHPYRISMLHVKNFRMEGSADKNDPTVTELGRGSITYAPVFAQAAKTQHIEHMFVEQEAFDIPWKESLKVDADYMRTFHA